MYGGQQIVSDTICDGRQRRRSLRVYNIIIIQYIYIYIYMLFKYNMCSKIKNIIIQRLVAVVIQSV